MLKTISLRVEVSLFVLSPEIEDRDDVEVGNWAKHKKTFYSEWWKITLGQKICYLQSFQSNKRKMKNLREL
jgi:hypothetical protein